MVAGRNTPIPSLHLEPRLFIMCVGVLMRALCSCCPTPCECPSPCECPARDNSTLCRRRFLSIVPSDLPTFSQILDLSHNYIRAVPSNAFTHLKYLQELDLSYNQLSRVEPGLFSSLPALRVLLLHHNELKLLPPGIFLGMPALSWLDVRRNQLVILLDQTFQGLRELKHLETGENPLLFVSPGAFLTLPQLQRLGLEDTKLNGVPSSALAALPRLSELRLGGISSSVLRDLSFPDLPLLRVLELDSWPSLGLLEPHSLSGLNLSSFSVTHGNLTTIPEEALKAQIYLRTLDLSYNPISELPARGFGTLRRLEELRLSSGRLHYVPSGAFYGLGRLRTLDLSDNPLTWLAEDALPSPLGGLETLLLSNTMLSCDCRLCWLLHRRLRFGGKSPVCAAPDSLRGMVIPDDPEKLCPDLFTCQPPRIVNPGPRELTVREGDVLTISCHSLGVPQPSIQWVLPQSPPLEDTTVRRVTILPDDALQFHPVQAEDSGAYLCTASNVVGNDSTWVHLEVVPYNGSNVPSSVMAVNGRLLVVITAGGILPFISSVTLCFIFMFLWSRGRGNIKHTAHIDYVPRGNRASTDTEDNKFTMKLL
uniref:Ig-like domain-containing protein n=1 Tax=Xenopus tropicalis TaxID=8364 RepID=A0A1B8XYK2_XENTR